MGIKDNNVKKTIFYYAIDVEMPIFSAIVDVQIDINGE